MSKKKMKQVNIESGRRVKDIRENRHKTQEEFAFEIGISPSALKKIESGENGVSTRVLRKFFDMNISSDYVLHGERKNIDKLLIDVENSTQEDKMKLFLKLLLEYTKDSNGEKLTIEQISNLLSETINKGN